MSVDRLERKLRKCKFVAVVIVVVAAGFCCLHIYIYINTTVWHTIICLIALCVFFTHFAFAIFRLENHLKAIFFSFSSFFLSCRVQRFALEWERVVNFLVFNWPSPLCLALPFTYQSNYTKIIFSYEIVRCAGALGQCEIWRFVGHFSCAKTTKKKEMARKSGRNMKEYVKECFCGLAFLYIA